MLLDKLPRWMLTLMLSGALGLAGICVTVLISRADAQISKNTIEIERVKTVAEQAQMQYAELRGAVQEVKTSNETFRKEYREDMHEIQKSLSELTKRSN